MLGHASRFSVLTCRGQMRRALDSYVIRGVNHNIPFLRYGSEVRAAHAAVD
jgi:hypothetical protein